MADLKAQVRDLGAQIEARKAEAGKAWAEFDGLRQSAKSEGVNFAQDTDAFEKLDAAGKQYDAIRDEVASMEAKRSRLLELVSEGAVEVAQKGGDEAVARSFGEAFVKSDVYRALKERAGMSESIPVGTTEGVKVIDRAAMKALVSIGVNADLAPQADRLSLIVPKRLATLDFLSVISTQTTDSDVVEYLEETTYTNAASPTAEGSDAPESTVTFTKRSRNVREITHFIPATRRALQDQAFVEGWLNERLIDGVRRRLQTQVLSGAGTSQDFEGIYNNSSIGSVDRSSASVTMLDSLHKCITTIRTNAFMEPDFIGIHPEDYEAISLARLGGSTTTDGPYAYGNPVAGGPATIWGVPAIVHTAFTSGTPLIGRGSEAVLWVRSGVEVSASDSHSDYFIKRQVAFLATMRAAFGVITPTAFAKSVA